jgi:hypothetical protein
MEETGEYMHSARTHLGSPPHNHCTWGTLENMQLHIQTAIPSSGCQIEWHLTIRMHGYIPPRPLEIFTRWTFFR